MTQIPLFDENEIPDSDKFNQLGQVIKEVKDSVPDVRYRSVLGQDNDVPRTSGLKVVGGVVPVGPDQSAMIVSKKVLFDNIFTPDTYPVVTATLATNDRYRTHVVINGLEEGQQNPTSEGFTIVLSHALISQDSDGDENYDSMVELTFARVQYVHYVAIGF